MEQYLGILICGGFDKKAIELRQKGYSIREIAKELKISYSTARSTTKHIKLTKDQKKKLLSNRKKLNRYNVQINYKNKYIKINGKLNISIHNKHKITKSDLLKILENELEEF